MVKHIFTAALFAACTLIPSAGAQHHVTRAALSSGTAAAVGESSAIRGTLGQSVIGISTDGSHISRTGFYYTAADLLTVIEQIDQTVPGSFQLDQNYPNPFNPRTTIQFSLPQPVTVRLALYDLRGRRIAVLTDEFYQAGSYRILFEAGELPSGIYIYRIDAGPYREAKRLILLK